MTPYQEALEWVRHHPNEPESISLTKLILSLHHPAYAFSFGECVTGIRDELTALSLRVVGQFVRVGREDESMLEIAATLADWYPALTRRAEHLARANAECDALEQDAKEADD